MQTPSIYSPEDLLTFAGNNARQLRDGTWVPARPEGFWGLCLRRRLHATWLVFTGRADVLKWTGQP